MVKSAFGFKSCRICPYFQAVDFVYGETTCDAKEKTWEILYQMVPTHVMEIPQTKSKCAVDRWLSEVKEFKTKVESVDGKEVTLEKLKDAVKVRTPSERHCNVSIPCATLTQRLFQVKMYFLLNNSLFTTNPYVLL